MKLWRRATTASWLDIVTTLSVVVASVGIIRSSLLREPAATPSPRTPIPSEPLSLDGAAVKGSRNASVALVVFSDFQCPACGQLARVTLPRVEEEYIRTGRVVLAYRHLPLEQIHPFAVPAAIAAECAGAEGKFWNMHDLLFADQATLNDAGLRIRAATLGLSPDRFAECTTGDTLDRVRADGAAAVTLGITGTPTTLVGTIDGNGKVVVQEVVRGAAPFETFRAALDRALRTSARRK